ncbi:hypothetical protein Hbl1158_17045 (plasmid) [Halobaculum sp. CBA1158]|uniref:hypothetical protein n=1 Tax=Halobaculum sp. CBA1158 TaxID=2904243 RepID=UPI001F3F234F|nr:hypothetical protein [Halobaculum sp. CBA1158]UIP01710.1 hypothetical protein Hbl1158_17045 [Halobaculum sp. CBA1158]
MRHPDRCIREVKGLPRGEEKPRIEFKSRLAHSGGDLRRENMTTVKYVSLMRCQGGNSAWEDEDGERTVIAGKKPKTWMPRVIVKTEDGREVIGVCYKREALAELPEWMNHEDAFKWARETLPDGFEEFYDGVEVEA